ncbi:MAG: insulinase family protein, partial [Bacteroidales bacterium]|nr:insulinase family protein [Bacteroidales bacterium]
ANPGVNLNDVEKAIFESFEKFEKEGFSEDDLTRIKAQYETRFYNSFESVLGKSFQLAEYTMYTGDPGYFRNDIEAVQAVTMDDVTDVYNRYIKGRHFVQTSFVPKGELHLIAEGSVNADIVEEDVTRAAEIISVDTEEEPIIKTPASFDRSVKPVPGPDPAVSLPQVWKSSLSNGLEILGIEHNELPLVEYTIIMDGGHITEELEKAGLSNLVASMMNEGTRNRTPEELEDAIGLLGASIRFSSATENISVNVSTLKRNFEKTTALVEEMLLEPRWDEEQFGLAKTRIINSIERNRANPSYLASSALNKLIFGEGSIMAVEASGTEESVSSITVDDLKDYYNKYFSPSTARLLVTGNVSQKEVETAFEKLGRKWMPKDIELPRITIPAPPEKSAVYFVDVPGAKQSVINIGAPSLPRTSPDFYSAFVANYKLGGSFNGVFNLILREEKGFTYGARSHFSGYRNFGIFSASSMVRTNSTLESVIIFKTEMEKYRENIPQEYVDFTKSALIKNNALSFETIRSLLSMLNNIASYGLPVDYIGQEEAFLTELTKEKLLELAKTFIDPSRMYYVVAGDAKTQLRELEKAGLGKPVLLK